MGNFLMTLLVDSSFYSELHGLTIINAMRPVTKPRTSEGNIILRMRTAICPATIA
jgi:hypothetical protein